MSLIAEATHRPRYWLRVACVGGHTYHCPDAPMDRLGGLFFALDAPLGFAFPQFLTSSYDRFVAGPDGLVVRDGWQTSYAAFFDAGQIVSYILTGGSCATR